LLCEWLEKKQEKIHIKSTNPPAFGDPFVWLPAAIGNLEPFCLSTKSANLVSFSKEQFSNIFLDTPGMTKKCPHNYNP
jgi:hypothetical protein